MTNIEVIRELHCYKRMYNCLQKTITGCIKECRDLVVREKLMQVQREAEDIYTGEIYEYKALNEDERTIVALLSFIMDNEISRVNDMNMTIIKDCVDWSLAIQNKKSELTKEYIRDKVDEIIAIANETEDSEL